MSAEGIGMRLSTRADEPPSPSEPWLSRKCLARHFGVSVRTVGTWLAAGLLYSILGGDGTAPRMVRVRASEAEQWAAEHRPPQAGGMTALLLPEGSNRFPAALRSAANFGLIGSGRPGGRLDKGEHLRNRALKRCGTEASPERAVPVTHRGDWGMTECGLALLETAAAIVAGEEQVLPAAEPPEPEAPDRHDAEAPGHADPALARGPPPPAHEPEAVAA
jgi:hypothetical protein